MDGAQPDITDGSTNGFDRWLTVAGLAYFTVLGVPGVLLKDRGLATLWFRTFLPVTYILAGALTWLFWPRPRPSWAGYLQMFAGWARSRPGAAIFGIGAGLSVEVFALTVPLRWPAATSVLRPFEIALIATTILAVVGGYVLRKAFPASR